MILAVEPHVLYFPFNTIHEQKHGESLRKSPFKRTQTIRIRNVGSDKTRIRLDLHSVTVAMSQQHGRMKPVLPQAATDGAARKNDGVIFSSPVPSSLDTETYVTPRASVGVPLSSGSPTNESQPQTRRRILGPPPDIVERSSSQLAADEGIVTRGDFWLIPQKKGEIYPGESEVAEIEFVPRQWDYVRDVLYIHAPGLDLPLTVEIHGYPSLMNLSIPPTIQFGSVSLFHKSSKSFVLKNDTPIPFDFDISVSKETPQNAFMVHPLSGTMLPFNDVEVQVTFLPLALCKCTMELRVLTSQFAAVPIVCHIGGTGKLLPPSSRKLRQDLEELSQFLPDKKSSRRHHGRKRTTTSTAVDEITKDVSSIQKQGHIRVASFEPFMHGIPPAADKEFISTMEPESMTQVPQKVFTSGTDDTVGRPMTLQPIDVFECEFRQKEELERRKKLGRFVCIGEDAPTGSTGHHHRHPSMTPVAYLTSQPPKLHPGKSFIRIRVPPAVTSLLLNNNSVRKESAPAVVQEQPTVSVNDASTSSSTMTSNSHGTDIHTNNGYILHVQKDLERPDMRLARIFAKAAWKVIYRLRADRRIRRLKEAAVSLSFADSKEIELRDPEKEILAAREEERTKRLQEKMEKLQNEPLDVVDYRYVPIKKFTLSPVTVMRYAQPELAPFKEISYANKMGYKPLKPIPESSKISLPLQPLFFNTEANNSPQPGSAKNSRPNSASTAGGTNIPSPSVHFGGTSSSPLKEKISVRPQSPPPISESHRVNPSLTQPTSRPTSPRTTHSTRPMSPRRARLAARDSVNPQNIATQVFHPPLLQPIKITGPGPYSILSPLPGETTMNIPRKFYTETSPEFQFYTTAAFDESRYPLLTKWYKEEFLEAGRRMHMSLLCSLSERSDKSGIDGLSGDVVATGSGQNLSHAAEAGHASNER